MFEYQALVKQKGSLLRYLVLRALRFPYRDVPRLELAGLDAVRARRTR